MQHFLAPTVREAREAQESRVQFILVWIILLVPHVFYQCTCTCVSCSGCFRTCMFGCPYTFIHLFSNDITQLSGLMPPGVNVLSLSSCHLLTLHICNAFSLHILHYLMSGDLLEWFQVAPVAVAVKFTVLLFTDNYHSSDFHSIGIQDTGTHVLSWFFTFSHCVAGTHILPP